MLIQKVDVLRTAPLITGRFKRSMAITGVESVLPAQTHIILKCFVILKQVRKNKIKRVYKLHVYICTLYMLKWLCGLTYVDQTKRKHSAQP